MCQVDHITSIARHASMVTTRLAALPCESVLQQMTENGALMPHIRSTGLIRDGIVICSSVTGVRQQSADEIFDVADSAPRENNYHSHGGTSSVPVHVAVIYAYGTCSGAKALMRYQRPDGRSISSGVFIQAAEEEGLIVSLTQHLFSLIEEDVRAWLAPSSTHWPDFGCNTYPAHRKMRSLLRRYHLIKLHEMLECDELSRHIRPS
ncbi:CSS-motif domain-containing protein [Enterobacter sp. UPMP2052]